MANETKKFLDLTGLTKYDENIKTHIAGITGNLSNLDTTNKSNLVGSINEVGSIAKGATVALSVASYSELISSFSSLPNTTYKVGQTVYVVTLDVPDLWISTISNTSSTYTYTTDAQVISDIEAGTFKVGYYTFSKMETQKVDLSDYVTESTLGTEIGGVEDKIEALENKKADKSNTVSSVSYDSGNKKLVKTIGAASTDIVSVSTLKSDMELNNVGNFKAVSTLSNQGLSNTEKSNARANIGAGTSSLVLGETSATAYYGDKGKTAYEHSQATHARTDATKVEASTTNGNIKINGTETTVYTHPSGTNPHGTTKSDVGLGNVTNDSQVKRSEMGVVNGVATLGSDGKIPSTQLPSFADDVLEYDKKSDFPSTGESGKIYVEKTNDTIWRWSGSTYVQIKGDLVIGTTAGTAADGKVVDDHIKDTSNPHSVTKAQVGLGNVGNFKAVSTLSNQGLSKTEKSNARANIGAGTSSLTLGNDASNAYYGDKGKIAYEHSQATHARTDATKVEASTTNGNIKINGTETNVYTHPSGTNPHGTTKSDVGLGNVTNDSQVKRSEMGVVNGVATLGSDGKVPTSQLPAYVDDVIDLLNVTGTAPSTCASGDMYYNTSSNKIFTATGTNTWGTTGATPESGKIYINLNNSKTYRWSGTTLAVISETLALGETSSTAYYGDRGKIAYDHSQADHARTDATKVEASTTNGNIKIDGTETNVYTLPSSDPYTSARTPTSHTHGNIANGGTLTDTAAAAAGNDYVVIRDADNSKIQTSTIKGTDVADAVSKKHDHTSITLSTSAQAYDGTHTIALPSSDPYSSARTPASHTHGNITNNGTITSTAVTSATGVLVYDSSNKIQRATAAQTRSIIGAGTSSLTLGTGASNAYYGDKGKTAYDHSQAAHARTDATNTDLTYDTTNKKITKTVNGTASDVVTASTIVTDGGGIKSHATHKLNATNGTASSVSQGTEITYVESVAGTTTATSGNLSVSTTRKKITVPAIPGAATQSADGLMSAADKEKLDGISTGANNYSHPTGDGYSHVPETGTTNNGKVLMAGSTANSASWQSLGTASKKNVPTSGNAATTEVVMGNDTRLSDSRTPTSHAHGNIANNGTITSTVVTSATGILVYDSSNKIQRATAAQTRSIIGAGTSSLIIGTTAETAADGKVVADHISNTSNPHGVTAAQVGLGNVTNESKATMFTNAALTGTPTAPTANAGTNTTQIATTAFVTSAVNALLGASDAMIFKGTIGSSGATVTALPASHKVGDTYKVITAGNYAGAACEIGDMIICITSGNSANNAHWTVVQSNIDGAVTGPSSSVNNRIATFNGTTGKVIKDSGFTIATSVPSGAVFTDKSVTAVGNHYSPSADANSELTASLSGTAGTFATNTEYTVLTGVKAQRDAKGHVTGLTYTAQKVKDTTIANTDNTGIKLATTVLGTKKTDSTLIKADSSEGLSITGGTDKFSISDGTNYIEVGISVSGKQATVPKLGTTKQPVYTSANGTFTTCTTYAGGTAVTLNGSSKGGSTAGFYAPTGAGTSGQILVSSGSGSAPTWTNHTAITYGTLGSAIDATKQIDALFA